MVSTTALPFWRTTKSLLVVIHSYIEDLSLSPLLLVLREHTTAQLTRKESEVMLVQVVVEGVNIRENILALIAFSLGLTSPLRFNSTVVPTYRKGKCGSGVSVSQCMCV